MAFLRIQPAGSNIESLKTRIDLLEQKLYRRFQNKKMSEITFLHRIHRLQRFRIQVFQEEDRLIALAARSNSVATPQVRLH